MVYVIQVCCVYSAKLMMMDRETVRNMYSFIPRIYEKLVPLVGFIIRIYHDAGSPVRQMTAITIISPHIFMTCKENLYLYLTLR